MQAINKVVENRNGNYKEKILQFGEGNFLRAFTDWMIDKANSDGIYEGSIVVCQPVKEGIADMLNSQDCTYTLAMRGIENSAPVERIETVTSISRCINPYSDYAALMELAASPDLEVVISNTTEAGIAYKEGDALTDAPPASFPAKIAAFLYSRYKAFDGAMDKGLLFLPVELIDNNGSELKKIVLRYAQEWNLGAEFTAWIEEANKFTSTLVDRIVTGYPRSEIGYFEEKLGYRDNAIVTSEIFNLWVIEGKKEWAEILPVHRTDANVIWTEDVTPYKKRKVRILNGAHTATVLAAYLSGHDYVLDFMHDDIFKSYLDKLIFDEIIPTLDLPKEELEEFAKAVSDRFANPYIKHSLLDISLNSCSKFTARCLPSLLSFKETNGTVPSCLSFALAAFIAFYKGEFRDGKYIGKRPEGTEYEIRDSAPVLEFFNDCWNNREDSIVKEVLSNRDFWNGTDLTETDGLEKAVSDHLGQIHSKGIRNAISDLV